MAGERRNHSHPAEAGKDEALWRFDGGPDSTVTPLIKSDDRLYPGSPAFGPDQSGVASLTHDLGAVSYKDAVETPALYNDAGILARAGYRVENGFLDLTDRFRLALQVEREAGSLFNFAPVILSIGIATYFSVANEPSMPVVAISALAFLVMMARMQSRGLVYVSCIAGLLYFLGMLAAQWQVNRTATPVPVSGLTGQIRGVVISVDQNQRGSPRYLIRPDRIEGLEPGELPKRVRISSGKRHGVAEPGSVISGLVRLSPISGPAYPGGYDFAFARWTQGWGMTGFFMGAPKHETELSMPVSLVDGFVIGLEHVRLRVSTRIRAGLPGEEGDIAAALITGDRSGLSEETQETLRRSGLAHILAISGLHMALVTLSVIWLCRLGLVLLPGLCEVQPIRKWAIAAGFLTATLYMFLSGAGIATCRAWLMVTVMLLASLLDRRAITMRSVAIAAMVLLLLDPASLFQPGFQMSFAAVAALVALYRDWTRLKAKRFARGERKQPENGVMALVGRTATYFGGLSATSLVAGLATALIAIWHFHRVAPLGLASNLLAMPLVSMLVMPLALVSMLLMPYGLEGLALAPLGVAINQVVDIAEAVNALETDFETGMMPNSFMIFASAFMVLLVLPVTRLRLLAVMPAAGLFLSMTNAPELPDILIAQDGRNIALRSSLLTEGNDTGAPDGLTLVFPGRGKFITDIWQRAFIPNREYGVLADSDACGRDICRIDLSGKRLVIVYKPDLVESACNEADILLAPRLWWTRCSQDTPKLTINRSDLEARGSYLVRDIMGDMAIETAWPDVADGLENRPWLRRFDNVSRRFAD